MLLGMTSLSISMNQQVDMVRDDNIIKNFQTKSFLLFIQPMKITISVFREFQEKLLLMASMGNMPDTTWYMMSICTGHVKP